MEQSDEWAVRRVRYMNRATIAPVSENPIIVLSAVPGTWPAQTDAGKHGATPKLHHVRGHHRPFPCLTTLAPAGSENN